MHNYFAIHLCLHFPNDTFICHSLRKSENHLNCKVLVFPNPSKQASTFSSLSYEVGSLNNYTLSPLSPAKQLVIFYSTVLAALSFCDAMLSSSLQLYHFPVYSSIICCLHHLCGGYILSIKDLCYFFSYSC